MEDPCQEAAMMFVKYCPDSTIASVFKFKAPDKCLASEVQEHIDRYQIEMKEVLFKSKCCRPAAVHTQATMHDESPVKEEVTVTRSTSNDDCLKVLLSLFDRALTQTSQSVQKPTIAHQLQNKHCRVCQSSEHSTLAHCRQERLCLSCFEPNHFKRDCPRRQSGQGPTNITPSQNSQTLN